MNNDAHNDSNNSFSKLRENFVDVTSYLVIVKVNQFYISRHSYNISSLHALIG